MKTKGKLLALLISLLMAFSSFMTFSAPVLAGTARELTPKKKALQQRKKGLLSDEGSGIGVHADPATFEKNFVLTNEQKEYTITEMQKVVDKITNENMSDLEKYYTLAIWANKHVEYDWDFWDGKYNMDLYRNQWDSYGAMKPDEKSVCVGIAIFYSTLCHAADLPCRFVRMDPSVLDHTISYIPDINGHPYYMDVTENMMFMSKESNVFEPIDLAFSNITRECDYGAFDIYEKGSDTPEVLFIKDFYKVSYKDFYNEYPMKKCKAKYEEKGSGVGTGDSRHVHHSYTSMPSQYSGTENGDIWFLEDFYKDPEAVKEKIENGELDKELLTVKGVQKNYNVESVEKLKDEIKAGISLKYFPSRNEDGKVVAQAAGLTEGTDYEITCTPDGDSGEVEVTLTGKGSYTGSYSFKVTMNTGSVSKEPVAKKGLVYNKKEQTLIEAGVAEGGELQYALGNETEATEEFSTELPARTDAGKYYVWYKVAGADGHRDSKPQRLEKPAKISPIELEIDAEYLTLKIGETGRINPQINVKGVQPMFTFSTSDDDIVTVSKTGQVTGLKEGIAVVLVTGNLKVPNPNYKFTDTTTVWCDVISGDLKGADVFLSEDSFTYNGKVQKPRIWSIKHYQLKAGTDYKATYSPATSRDAGKYTITVKGIGYFYGTTKATYIIKKAANPMKVKAKTVKVKYKTLRKKNLAVKRSKAVKVSRPKGKVVYKIVSAKKGSKRFRKKIRINAKTGKITLKKGLKKGTYKVKIKIKAKGNKNFKASAWKSVTVKVKVK